ncbi:MAG: hypothetical protein ACLUNS_09275 [Alistipes shahii]
MAHDRSRRRRRNAATPRSTCSARGRASPSPPIPAAGSPPQSSISTAGPTSTSDLGKAAGADIAANGSYFNVKTFEPVTFVLLDRKIVGRTTPEETFRTNGVIAFKDRKGRRMEIFPLRHDAVCRRGAPLPLGAGRRPGADRRRQGGRIHLREQLLHAAAIPGR